MAFTNVASLSRFGISWPGRTEVPRPVPAVEQVDLSLLEWLSYRGLPPQKVTLSHTLREGRGLLATQYLRRHEKLLKIPGHLLLTADVALQKSAYGELLERAEVPAWSVLATFLAETRCQPEGAKNEWGEYVDALPLRSGGVLEWSPEEVGLLQGTAAMRGAERILQSFELSFVELEPILGEAVGAAHRPLTVDDLRWGFSMLLSRLVRLPSMDMEALVPWADMLNHDPSADCFLDWDAPLSSVVLHPDRNYRAGEQVYMSYGPKSDSEMLLSYGFAPAALSNPHNACGLRVSLLEDDPMFSVKRDLLLEADLLEADKDRYIDFPLRLDALPKNLLNFADFVITSAPGKKKASAIDQGGSLDGSEIKAAIDLVMEQCKAALASISGTLEGDQEAVNKVNAQIAKAATAHMTSLQRRRDIYQIRINERKILNKTLYTLRCQRTTA